MNLLLDALGSDIKPAGQDKWVARCPVHSDSDMATSIKMLSDGRVIAHCHACGANGYDIYVSLGLDTKAGLDELNGGKGVDPNYMPQGIRDNLNEDRVFMRLYDKSVKAGERIMWEDQKRHKLAVARIAGIEAKYGDRI